MRENEVLAAHIADLHWSEKRLDEKIRCADQIVKRIEILQPDVIVAAGDIFDRPIRMEEPAAMECASFFSRLAEVAPIAGIRGNFAHDRDSTEILPFIRGSYPIMIATEPSIYVLGPGKSLRKWKFSDALITDGFQDARAVFFGLPYPSQSFLAETSTLSPDEMRTAVSAAITKVVQGFGAMYVPPGIPKGLIFHGTITGAQFSETQRETGMDIMLSPFDVGLAGFHVTMAGHLHFMQRIVTSSGEICYPGGLACTHWGETGPKGMWEHRFSTSRDNDYVMTLCESTHFDVGARPMQVLEVDMSNPFFEIPEWARTGSADIQVRVKMTEADRERLSQMNWAELMPAAASINIAPTIEQVESVRCEEVQTARSLREKVAAWRTHQQQTEGNLLPMFGDSVLDKSDLLESVEADAIIASLKGA